MTDLALTLAELARDLHFTEGSRAVMQCVSERAVLLVPGADYASVSLLKGSTIDTIAATDELIHMVDGVQEALGEGPCVAAASGEVMTEVAATSTDAQWPRYSREAAVHGIGATLGFQLALTPGEGRSRSSLGALNLYSRAENGFSDRDRALGELLATHAATAIAAALLKEQLTEAIERRDVIGQAKGVLMERLRLTSESAFELLVRQSKDTNTKLHEVAESVVAGRG